MPASRAVRCPGASHSLHDEASSSSSCSLRHLRRRWHGGEGVRAGFESSSSLSFLPPLFHRITLQLTQRLYCRFERLELPRHSPLRLLSTDVHRLHVYDRRAVLLAKREDCELAPTSGQRDARALRWLFHHGFFNHRARLLI